MLEKIVKNPTTQNYIAGVTAAWAIYTPAFAMLESHSGYDAEQIIYARAFGALTHTVVGPAVQYMRKEIGKWFRVTKNQPARKFMVNELAVLAVQPATYLTILGATALITDQSLKEFWDTISYALPRGLAIAMAVAPAFGIVVDNFWKKLIFKSPETFPATLEEIIEQKDEQDNS